MNEQSGPTKPNTALFVLWALFLFISSVLITYWSLVHLQYYMLPIQVRQGWRSYKNNVYMCSPRIRQCKIVLLIICWIGVLRQIRKWAVPPIQVAVIVSSVPFSDIRVSRKLSFSLSDGPYGKYFLWYIFSAYIVGTIRKSLCILIIRYPQHPR